MPQPDFSAVFAQKRKALLEAEYQLALQQHIQADEKTALDEELENRKKQIQAEFNYYFDEDTGVVKSCVDTVLEFAEDAKTAATALEQAMQNRSASFDHLTFHANPTIDSQVKMSLNKLRDITFNIPTNPHYSSGRAVGTTELLIEQSPVRAHQRGQVPASETRFVQAIAKDYMTDRVAAFKQEKQLQDLPPPAAPQAPSAAQPLPLQDEKQEEENEDDLELALAIQDSLDTYAQRAAEISALEFTLALVSNQRLMFLDAYALMLSLSILEQGMAYCAIMMATSVAPVMVLTGLAELSVFSSRSNSFSDVDHESNLQYQSSVRLSS